MKGDVQIQAVLKGAWILIVSSLIAKVLSALYRIPLQNLVGNIGFYVYQQVYPIYGIGMTFALSGLPVLISKLVAEQPDMPHRVGLLRRVHVLLVAVALLIFMGLQSFAPRIAFAMGDLALTSVIRAVNWMFLLMPLLSSLRGFFQGTLDMVPTAISQVVEQIVRVAIIVLVAWLAHAHDWNLYRMGRDAMMSSPISALFSSTILLVFAIKYLLKPAVPPKISYWQLGKQLLVQGVVVCLLSALMLLMQLVDSFTIRKGLLAFGLDPVTSQVVKGIYDRAQPIVQLGLVVGTAFASAAMPSLAQAVRVNDQRAFRLTSRLIVKISWVAGLATTAGLVTLMPAVNFGLFGDGQGSMTLSVYCLSILVMTLITVYNGILQSRGDFQTGLIVVLVSCTLKVALTTPLVVRFGIIGGSVATVIAVLGGLLINLLRAPGLVDWRRLKLGRQLIATLLMVGVVWLVQFGLNLYLGPMGRVARIIGVAFTALVGAATFGGLILKLGVFSDAELLALPYLKRLVPSRRDEPK